MGVAADYVSRTKIGAYFQSMRESRKLILFIVAVALLLDNMLLTIVGKARNYTFAQSRGWGKLGRQVAFFWLK